MDHQKCLYDTHEGYHRLKPQTQETCYAARPIPLRFLCHERLPVSGSLRSSQYNPMGRVRWDRALSSALFCRLNHEASYTRVVLSLLRVAPCVVPCPGLAGASHRNSCFACTPTTPTKRTNMSPVSGGKLKRGRPIPLYRYT